MDSKDSRKSYCIKISHPSEDTYFFATDSRISIERWIEVLSLAATGRLDVIAPYPPYFCAEQSGDELKSRSRESLLSCEVRLVLIWLCSRRIQPSLPSPTPHLHHCRTLPPQRKRKEGTAVLFAGETSAIWPQKSPCSVRISQCQQASSFTDVTWGAWKDAVENQSTRKSRIFTAGMIQPAPFCRQLRKLWI